MKHKEEFYYVMTGMHNGMVAKFEPQKDGSYRPQHYIKIRSGIFLNCEGGYGIDEGFVKWARENYYLNIVRVHYGWSKARVTKAELTDHGRDFILKEMKRRKDVEGELRYYPPGYPLERR